MPSDNHPSRSGSHPHPIAFLIVDGTRTITLDQELTTHRP